MKRIVFILSIAVATLAGCNIEPIQELPGPTPPETVKEKKLPNVDSLVRTASVIGSVSTSSTIELKEGVIETEMVMTLTSGLREKAFIVTADIENSDLDFQVAQPDNITLTPTGKWPRRTLTYMAKTMEVLDREVVAMVNADFWNTTTILPKGAVHTQGKVLKTSFESSGNKQGITFVGYSPSKGFVISSKDAYFPSGEMYTELTGSGIILVRDGEKVDNSSWPASDRHPRSALGYTADGILYLFSVDGRDPGVSEGMTYDEMGSIFAALKCQAAVNLDGGGSTQMLIRDPSTQKPRICNKPSDGTERPVINAWAIIDKP